MKKHWLILYAAISCFNIVNVCTATDIPAGDVSGTWTRAGSPYLVQGDIILQPGETLVIDPGVTVEFQGYYEFTVRGMIHAIGTTNDTILFTVNDPSGFYTDLTDPAGSWNGILFDGSDNSVFYCCRFEYAKALGELMQAMGGAMKITSSGSYTNLMIRASHFAHNYARLGGAIAVFSAEGDFTIDSCLFSNNTSSSMGGAIYTHEGMFFLRSNEFRFNDSDRGGAIAFEQGAEIKLFDNRIHHNTAGSGGGIYSSYNGEFTAVNNIISNNHANYGGGIYSGATSYPQIINNLIVNNSAVYGGGAIDLYNSHAIMTNNTLAFNQAGTGGGCYIYNSNPEFQNCIIWHNVPSQVHLQPGNSIPNIYYTNIQGGINGFTGAAFYGEAGDTLSIDPEFEEEPAGAGYLYEGLNINWALVGTSPCLNAGNPDVGGLNLPEYDIYGRQRIRNSIVDLGAAETHVDVIIANTDINTDVYWLADTVRVTNDISIGDGATLTISPGTVVQFQGYYKIEVKGTLIARGNPGDTIRFTVPPENRSEGWNGIRFDNAQGIMFDNDSSLFERCIFEYANNPQHAGQGGAMNIRYFSRIRVSNSVFRYDTAYYGPAINIELCSPVVSGNLFTRNHATYGVVSSHFGSPLILENTFVSNTSSWIGGGLYGYQSDPYVKDNFFANNQGAVFASHSNTKSWIMTNNVISNNDVALYIDGTDLILVNNTIANNDTWGINFSDGTLTILNSVFSGNKNNSINTTEPVVIYNCLVEGGLDKLVNVSMPSLEQGNNIDGTPEFINPTPASGLEHQSMVEDWQISSFSDCINEGTNTFDGFAFPTADILGNPRINSSTIDIGAFENQDELVHITRQPQNSMICESDSVTLFVEVSDTARYQWLKNGVDLQGEASRFLTFHSLDISDQGNYACMVSNAYGTVESNPAYILVNERARFLSGPGTMWVQGGKPVKIDPFYKGTNPEFRWEKDGSLLPGENLPELNLVVADSSQEGVYRCIISNSCGTDTTPGTTLYLAPQICMVTVSEISGYNLVVWEKKSIAPIMAYNVYRESSAAGIYDLLTTVPYDELSVFVDTVADPTMQAYLYKITAIDTAENETDADLCKPHKTIHLLVSTNPELNTTQLEWDRYYGFDYSTYRILRSIDGSVFDQVGELSSNLNSWTDIEPLQGEIAYRIAVDRPSPCYPEGGDKKAGTAVYEHSLSNLDDNKLKAGQLPPDTITLSNHSIEEENMPATVIGKLFTEDQDSIDSHSYQFVPGEGADDNASFTLLGDLLLASESFDYETKNQYTIRIRSTDLVGNFCEVPFIIQIIDVDETTGLPVLNAGSVKAFPNPFSQATTLTFPNPTGEPYTMILTDLSGKVVRTAGNIVTGEIILQRGNLEKGIYLVELRGGKILRGKIIIR